MAIKIIIPVIYLLLAVIHAWYHAYLIEEKNKTILSTQKIFERGLVAFVAFWSLLTWAEPIELIILPIVTGLAFNDTLLNWWRGRHWLHEGVISRKKSGLDYVEYKIGWPQWVFRIIYFTMYIVYLLTYFNVI